MSELRIKRTEYGYKLPGWILDAYLVMMAEIAAANSGGWISVDVVNGDVLQAAARLRAEGRLPGSVLVSDGPFSMWERLP